MENQFEPIEAQNEEYADDEFADDDFDDEATDEFDDESTDDADGDSNDYTRAPSKPVIAMSTLPVTGEARVDDALGRLTDLTNLPVHEHVAVFEDVQRRLHETLADLSGQ